MIPMKNLMVDIFHFLFFVLPVVIAFSCASSSVIVELDIDPQLNTIIEVMPLSDAEERLNSIHTDWVGHGRKILEQKSGLYTPCNKEDHSVLRRSLIKSLRKSQAFKDVVDVRSTNELNSDMRLYMSFVKSGMYQTSYESFCVINAFVWVETATDSVMVKKQITSKGQSGWSKKGARNDAIGKFIFEVSRLLSMNDE